MGPYLKAIWSSAVSGIIAFLTSLLTALQGENSGFDTITAGQWVTAVLAFFVAVAGTGATAYRVSNRPSGTPADAGAPAGH